MNEPLFGQIITDPNTPERDAIHVACYNCEALFDLKPGTHVDKYGSNLGELVGIVDPYLYLPVKKGQRFWIFLYPKTVTGLQHQWQHPEFSENQVTTIGRTYIREVVPVEDDYND